MAYPTDEVVRLTNGIVDLEVPIAFGPRILRYGFVGGRNVLAHTPDTSTPTPLGPWFPVGGHRLWIAPETMPGSYAPDMRPLDFSVDGSLRAEFRAPTDASGMEKTMRLEVAPSGSRVVLTHIVTNRTCWPVRIAPWAITIVDAAGTALVPQPPFRSHAESLLPSRPLVQWAYTNLTDTRWRIGRRLIALTPDAAKPDAQKLGVANTEGWCAVTYRDCTFVKAVAWQPGASYPDLGCNNEFFTAGHYLEVETLAPLTLIEPGAAATHDETWYLLGSGVQAHDTDEQLERAIVAALVREQQSSSPSPAEPGASH